MKYRVMFGVEVEAENQEEAAKMAGKELATWEEIECDDYCENFDMFDVFDVERLEEGDK